jgi:hypothetical protein
VQALRSGVVPRIGQQHIQVGRLNEVRALLSDINAIADGGTSFRFVIGDYGSGKTFFINLIRALALEKKLVTVNADLSPDRRLHATGGQARSLYAELMHNMSTRAKPEGGAMASVIERFVTSALTQAREEGVDTEKIIQSRLSTLSEMTGGYDFATVISAYWKGYDEGNQKLQDDAIRWMRGEFTTKTDARAALGVRTFIDDANVYDQLKLLSTFVVMAGFDGLLVCLDEMVNLYKLANAQARNANYEQILRMLNDSLQGTSSHLGFLLGGTPDFLKDTRRGLYSYAALQSRLAENAYAVGGFVDYSSPVLPLANLVEEDMFVLLTRLRHVFATGDASKYLIPDEGLNAFMLHCSKRVGDAYFRTPRTTVKEFLNLLSILEQNATADWRLLLNSISITAEANPDGAPIHDAQEDSQSVVSGSLLTSVPHRPPQSPQSPQTGSDDGLATFRL